VLAAPTHRELAVLVTATARFCATRRGGSVVSIECGEALTCDIDGPFVSQRLVDADALGQAITAAVAESPDVMVVVAPNRESYLDAVCTAAGGERLVIIGVIAHSSIDALSSLVQAAASAETRATLAQVFVAAASERHVRRLGGGHVTVRDLLRPDPDVRRAIEHGEPASLATAVRAGAGNIRSSDGLLARAVVTGRLSLRSAVAHASDAAYLVTRVRRQRRDRQRTKEQPGPANG
jgi:Tfp pilus assembly pilus retraction ATPase PilT